MGRCVTLATGLLALGAALTLGVACGEEALTAEKRPYLPRHREPTATPSPEPLPAAAPEPTTAPEPPGLPCPKRRVSGESLRARPQLRAFTFTGERQTFEVPAGVTALAVKLWGGGGGTCGPNAGGGGYVSVAALAVTPGEALEIVVGGGGVCRVARSPGGFGGGGDGSDQPAWAWSGSGGGRSAIVRGGRDVVTAGGGGGAGYPVIASEGDRPNGPAGDGCAAACGAGGDAPSRGGGEGGQLDRGGAAGDALAIGHAGGALAGGDGLSVTEGFVTSGGGGGGYFGGGSGGHEVHVTSGGGGGGACWGPAGATYDGALDGRAGGIRDLDYPVGVARGGDALEPDGGPGAVFIAW